MADGTISQLTQMVDTFFNGRPAPATPQTVRVKLTREHMAELMQGKPVHFQAGPIAIELVQAKRA